MRLTYRDPPRTAISSSLKQNLLASVSDPVMAWTGYPQFFVADELRTATLRKR
jgi:hypothetical protein